MSRYQNEKVLFENKPTDTFNEAYPIGNGFLGGMVYGDPETLKISLNHDELWTGFKSDTAENFDKSSYEKARDFALAGKFVECTKILEGELARYDGGAYLPLGDLFLCGGDCEFENYRRELDLGKSVATVSFEQNGLKVTSRAYASAPSKVLVQHTEFSSPVTRVAKLVCPFAKEVVFEKNMLLVKGECPKTCFRQKEESQFYKEHNSRHGIRFVAGMTVKTDGNMKCENGEITVSKATFITIYMTCDTSYKKGSECGKNEYLSTVKNRLSDASALEEEKILCEHIADFSKYFDRVELSFDGKDCSEINTTERIKNYQEDNSDTGLVTLAFNLGRYFLICGSRQGSMPLNLQGIWNDKVEAPWCSNYTTNINTEMNYWPALHSGLADMLDPLIDLLFILHERGQFTAIHLFGARGTCCFHNTDIFGYALPAYGNCQWSFFPLAFGWLIREAYNKYLYTLDKDYLKKIYPLFEDACKFYLDLLVDDGEYLIIAPGTSAENSYELDGNVLSCAKSSTFFGTIVREVFNEFKDICNTLGEKNDTLEGVLRAIPRLLPIRIMDDGRIEEWYFGGKSVSPKEHEVHHRHLSQLYGLYPANEMNTEQLREACIKSLDTRGDDATGWSLGWKLNCRARLGDSEAVERLLKLFFRYVQPDMVKTFYGGGVYGNLFCAHPPFQIDGNFGLTSAIYEMILGDADGELHPLIALPKFLSSGYLKGAYLRGNRRCDLTFKDGKVTELKIY